MILWKGIDREGHFKGIKTLFIGSPKITVDEIEIELNKDIDIKQLYFGAGETTKINVDILQKCVDKFSYLIITAEIDLDDLHTYNLILFNDVNVVVSITNKNIYLLKSLQKDKIQIKLQTLEPKQNRFLTMSNYNKFELTDMKNYIKKVYVDDEVLK